jgi:transcriptional regulator
VHLTGIVKAITSPEKAKRTLVNMTHFLESPDHNYLLEIDDPRMDSMINFIHAFEIEITHWEGKFKLSQDKCEQDQINAIDQLINTNRERIDVFMNNLLK